MTFIIYIKLMVSNHLEDKKITDGPIEPTCTGYVYIKANASLQINNDDYLDIANIKTVFSFI